MKLSIILITYRHEKYIRKCIESIIEQEFDFEWELVIAYDYCTDKTLLIAEEYRDKIKNFSICVQKTNVGISANCADAIAQTKGELIAFIDGDDYNTDTRKYIKQVAVFDQHIDVAFCFSNGYRYVEGSSKPLPFYDNALHIPQEFDLEYSYRHNVKINPTSMMCRKTSLPDQFPHFFYKHQNLDWMLASFCALKGKIFFLDEFLSCYRIHSASILRSTKAIDGLLSAMELNKQMNKYLDYKFDWFLGNDSWYFEHLTYEYTKVKEMKKAFSSASSYLFNKKRPRISDLRYFFATIYNIQFRQ